MKQAMEVPFTDPDAVLPGAQFADSYALTIEGQNFDAISATKAVMGRNPAWISTTRANLITKISVTALAGSDEVWLNSLTAADFPSLGSTYTN